MTTRQQASKREQERIRNNLPFTDEEWAIIKAAQADFWTFLNTVYANSFEGEEFLYADGTFGPLQDRVNPLEDFPQDDDTTEQGDQIQQGKRHDDAEVRQPTCRQSEHTLNAVW